MLAPYARSRYDHVSAPLVGKKLSATGGGDVGWNRLGKELPEYLSQGHAVVTTLIDLYRLKSNMPGYQPPGATSSQARAEAVELAMASILSDYIRNVGHFVPYVQVNEYEALLFSEPRAFEEATGLSGSARLIEDALRGCGNPEDVNGVYPPGVRLTGWSPEYNKRTDGLIAAQAIGTPRCEPPAHDSTLG